MAFERGRREARVDLTKKRFILDYFPAVSNVNFKWDMKMERKECAKYFGCKMGRVWLEDRIRD